MKKRVNRRIILKITGEALKSNSNNIDFDAIKFIASQIKPIIKSGLKIGLVIGGGNIFRGKNLIEKGFKNYKAHYIGMFATIMNAIALEEILNKENIKTKIYSSIEIPRILSFYNYSEVEEDFGLYDVLIFAGGTGNPFFTTDSAAALRAAECSADIIIKATKVDGIFTKDPEKYKDVEFIKFIDYKDYLENNYKIIDQTAVQLCKENDIPIIVVNFFKEKIFEKIFNKKQRIGSLIFREDIWPI